MTTAIVRYDVTLQARAGRWVDLAPDDRRRQATAAAQMKDATELWSLLEAFLATYGTAGATISTHTMRAYQRGLTVFLDYANTQALNLIRPRRDAGARWLRSLEADGQATVYRARAAGRRADAVPGAAVGRCDRRRSVRRCESGQRSHRPVG